MPMLTYRNKMCLMLYSKQSKDVLQLRRLVSALSVYRDLTDCALTVLPFIGEPRGARWLNASGSGRRFVIHTPMNS